MKNKMNEHIQKQNREKQNNLKHKRNINTPKQKNNKNTYKTKIVKQKTK